MTPRKSETDAAPLPPADRVDRARWWIVVALQLIMAGALVAAIFEGLWFDAVIIAGIILVMFVPTLFGRRYRIQIPPEFELMAVIFVFAAFFLGDVRGYYARFWWWDVALHSTSGLLLGIFGFLLVYLLNEDARVNLNMRPRFVVLFAFVFAVACGALWEIFEFAMDQLAGTTMQKPMLDDASGLTDTMWDLIVDTLGAAIIAAIGWWYMHRGRVSFVDIWIQKFIARNPRLFTRRG